MTPLRERMLEELQRRRYLSETIRVYLSAVKHFATYFGKRPALSQADCRLMKNSPGTACARLRDSTDTSANAPNRDGGVLPERAE